MSWLISVCEDKRQAFPLSRMEEQCLDGTAVVNGKCEKTPAGLEKSNKHGSLSCVGLSRLESKTRTE